MEPDIVGPNAGASENYEHQSRRCWFRSPSVTSLIILPSSTLSPLLFFPLPGLPFLPRLPLAGWHLFPSQKNPIVCRSPARQLNTAVGLSIYVIIIADSIHGSVRDVGSRDIYRGSECRALASSRSSLPLMIDFLENFDPRFLRAYTPLSLRLALIHT